MADDDPREIQAKIDRIKSQVENAKNGHYTIPSDQHHLSYRGARDYAPPKRCTANRNQAHPYPATRGHIVGFRGAYRGSFRCRGGRPISNRHNSLILNGGTASTSTAKEKVAPPTAEANKGYVIKKNGGSTQLIKGDLYDQTLVRKRRLVLEKRQRLEQARIEEELKRLQSRTVVIDDIPFRVVKRGKKLARIPGSSSTKATPKTAVVAGVRFTKSKTGHMYRDSSVRLFRIDQKKKSKSPCKVFSNKGSCAMGPDCSFTHDPSKVAVCKTYISTGSCPSGDSCDLSHELTPQRTPSCVHFARGNCSNAACRYTHVRVSPAALVCNAFGNYGYCEKGTSCTERHVHECPAFSNTGKCNTKRCSLTHREKASVMRSNMTRTEDPTENNGGEISSDEEAFGSEDLDSDEVEEFFGDDDGGIDEDIPQQQDYVAITT
ncbi:ccch zinc finger DNA-binding protein [Diplocarpon rosae]|nr:ccch zinc finger DNA-binding protein [Diplocarpon rosae]